MGSEFPTKLSSSLEDETSPGAGQIPERTSQTHSVAKCSVCHLPFSSSSDNPLPVESVCLCHTPPVSLQHTSPVRKHKKKNSDKLGPSSSSGNSKRQLFKEESSSTSAEITSQVITPISLLTETRSTNVSFDQPGTSRSSLLEDSPSTSSSTAADLASYPNLCTICMKSFNSAGKLAQHMHAHSGEKPFVCDHCFKAFSSKFKLVRHVLIHSDLRQYHCSHCERTFHRKDHLKNHAKIHSPVKRRLKCDREGCGKEYSSPLSFKKHTAVHAAEEGSLECKICNQVFSTKDEIVFHLKVHAGSRSAKTPADRKYQCDFCDRSFFTAKDVRRHLVVHTGKRDFLCQFCPQRFGRKDHLTRHIRKSHCNSNKSKKNRRSEKDKSKPVDSILESFSASRNLNVSSSASSFPPSTSPKFSLKIERSNPSTSTPETLLQSSGETTKNILEPFSSSHSQVPTPTFDNIPSTPKSVLKSKSDFISISLEPELPSAESGHVQSVSTSCDITIQSSSSLYSSVVPLWHKPQDHFTPENILDQPTSSTMLPELVYNPHASPYSTSYDNSSSKIEPLSPFSASFDAVAKLEPPSPFSTFDSSEVKMDPEFASDSNLTHFMELIPSENIHELESFASSQHHHHHHQHTHSHPIEQTQPFDPPSVEMSSTSTASDQQFTAEETSALPRDLLQYLPNTELINTLLQSDLPEDSSATLPTFNQAFQQQQSQPPP